jgi:hypothetical protein
MSGSTALVRDDIRKNNDHKEHTPLGPPAAAGHLHQIQEIRTYYEFPTVGNDGT